jgi:hypothetical protein
VRRRDAATAQAMQDTFDAPALQSGLLLVVEGLLKALHSPLENNGAGGIAGVAGEVAARAGGGAMKERRHGVARVPHRRDRGEAAHGAEHGSVPADEDGIVWEEDIDRLDYVRSCLSRRARADVP